MYSCVKCRYLRSEMRLRPRSLAKYVVLCLGALLVAHPSVKAQFTPGSTVQVSKQVAFPSSFTRKMSYPALANGYLLSYTHSPLQAQASASPVTFKLTSIETGSSQVRRLALPANDLVVEDAEAAPGGGFVAVGSYAGTESTSPTSFLTSVTPGGGTGFMLTLGAFQPDHACVGADGTTWVLGHEPAKESGSSIPDYDLVLAFSPSGVQIGHYLPRSTFSTTTPVSFRKGQVGTAAFLDCTATGSGAYVSVHGQSVWTEFTTGKSKATVTPVLPPSKSRVTGLAFVSPGVVYASIISGGSQHLYKLALHITSSSEWDQVQTEGNFARLLGKDAGSLVYFNADTDRLSPQLIWSRP